MNDQLVIYSKFIRIKCIILYVSHKGKNAEGTIFYFKFMLMIKLV